MNTKKQCECDQKGELQPGVSSWYDPQTELPFVNHEPGECKCTNELKEYTRENGKKATLCSCCKLSSDQVVKS